MQKQALSIARKASSIVLCRSNPAPSYLYDYQILMLDRKSSLSFGSASAFPGGMYEQLKDNQICQKYHFQSNLYATAVRECFQETGLFLTSQPILETQKLQKLQQLKNYYIAQSLKNNQSSIEPYFNQICQILDPIQKMKKFIRLITIPLLKRRYDTLFYVTKLNPYNFVNFNKYAQKQAQIHNHNQIIIGSEFDSFKWRTPLESIHKFHQKQIVLAPPQYIMLNIMSNFKKFDDFQQFLTNCSQQQSNFGPNIVTMVFNDGYNKQNFPFAATLVGDRQFPFLKNIETEKCQDLKEQLRKQQLKDREQKTNRILFKKPQQFFQSDYDVECTLPNSVLTKFNSSSKMNEMLGLYC